MLRGGALTFFMGGAGRRHIGTETSVSGTRDHKLSRHALQLPRQLPLPKLIIIIYHYDLSIAGKIALKFLLENKLEQLAFLCWVFSAGFSLLGFLYWVLSTRVSSSHYPAPLVSASD